MSDRKGNHEDNPKELEPEFTVEDNTEDFLEDLKKSLSTQVNETIQAEGAASYNNNDPKINKIPDKEDKKKGINKVIKYAVLPILIILSIVFFLINTETGRNLVIRMISNYSYSKLDYEAVQEPVDTMEPGEKPVIDTTDNIGQKPTEDKTVSNILLVGVETFGGAQNTDTMIIASLDSKNNVIKLTSLMRDLYVQIPGYRDNKLNSAYGNGGINLLYNTIKTNFGVTLDGYVLVDFDDFEEIIDYIGGIDIELTAKEAQYLRTTNYISNPSYRNVRAGVQHMNGNQVLGYCRIRKVPTATENSDFGRTQRQRIVLEKIFEKLRKKNVIQLGMIMNNILSNIDIKTDITKNEYNEYLQQAVYLERNELETFRIPKDGTYYSESVRIGRYKQDVLVPNSWEATRSMLHDFIYGEGRE